MVDPNDPRGAVSGRNKTLLALAAAIGGGCRTCAERLTAAARSQGMSDGEIEWAFAQGLEARRTATQLMREKTIELVGRDPNPGQPGSEPEGRLGDLAQLAAAVAANAAPAALRHAEAARSAGAAGVALDVARAIGRTIRGKAQAFSDAELGEENDAGAGEGDRAASCCC